MSRPGTTITRSETRPARSARTATGPLFMAGITGTADADDDVRSPVTSLTEYATRFGNRAAHADTDVYDTVEFYFKEGGAELFVSPTADAVDASLTAALALFTRDLGPGQVIAPGRDTEAQHVILAEHARSTNRIALGDAPDTDVVATLTGLGDGLTEEQARYIALFGPWVTVPGTTAGTTRDIPPSGIVAGIMARNDAAGITPNQPSAGVLGQSNEGLTVTQAWTDDDRNTLNLNGINVLRAMYDGVRVYGFRTLADPDTDDAWVNLANARMIMAIQAQADAIAERFVFRQLDGRRHTVQEYGGALTGMLLPYWQQGSLYGANPNEAFRVDVGSNVNTDESMAAGELRANIGLRVSPFAEEVIIELVKTRTTEAV